MDDGILLTFSLGRVLVTPSWFCPVDRADSDVAHDGG